MSEVLLIMLLLALSCSLIGCLLVVSNQSPVADALSHSVLLGIVLAFLWVQDLGSPWLVLGATVFGLLAVYGIEWLSTRYLAYDAATGLVFAFFFALAVILISIFARNVHLDMDMVLMGEVLFAPLYRTVFLGFHLPVGLLKSMWLFGAIVLFFIFFYYRLQHYLFDSRQAQLFGMRLVWLRFVTMSLVSLVIVTAFDIVGVISVISFLIAPAMTALFWAKRFSHLLCWSVLFALITVFVGHQTALQFDLTMAGTCAFVGFIVFLVNFLVYLGYRGR